MLAQVAYIYQQKRESLIINLINIFMFKKYITVLSVFVIIVVHCFGQQIEDSSARTSISVGFFMGGGSLIGTDAEFLFNKRIGLQFGSGIVSATLGSVGLGLNYHLKPYINSQFVSIVYWNQGFGDYHYASYFGPVYSFRARKIFQFGIGFGTVMSKGPVWNKAWENKTAPGNVALLYNIGLFFPLN